jgi:hypothetical protein
MHCGGAYDPIMDRDGDMQPTFFGVSCLSTIEMEVVLDVVNRTGGDETPPWRPGLLLVQGWPLGWTGAVLREVTAMNAKPRRRQSPVVLLSGLSSDHIEAASSAARGVGADVRPLPLVSETCAFIPGLSAESFDTVFDSAGAFGPDPAEPVLRMALLVARGWQFTGMQIELRGVVEQALAAERAARGEEPNWPVKDGPLVIENLAGFLAGDEPVLATTEPEPMTLPQALSPTRDRICMAWGLSAWQARAAWVAADDLGADVEVWAREAGSADIEVYEGFDGLRRRLLGLDPEPPG